MRVDGRERLRSVAGGFIGILITGLVSRGAGSTGAAAWLVAPMGASAVLVFAVPASPLAQPWSVVGGNTLSALVGAACAMAIPDPAWAGAAAVALAIGLMFQLRCLHPPGGAAALLCALGGVGLKFALFPVALNAVLLALAGVAYNRLAGRRYPHTGAAPAPAAGSRFSAADLDAALAHYNQVLDVSRDDLGELLEHAEAAAYERRFGELRCADVMTRKPLAVQSGTLLQQAWDLMLARQVKALPVIDPSRRVVGIVTRADFLRHAGLPRREGLADRLRALLRPSGLPHADKPEVVGQIMTRAVRVASAGRRVSELVPVFSDDGHHHIPVIDKDRRLVGVITQSDFVRALYRAAAPG
ncbi:HPP family protein [Xylophilus sp.]|uniref:HPP family protein n=1 Tax=Xylophilus sp. TaxID=2653893 RepID=UPI002D809405|nr:HPP family protein [Xylophilus sp.]